MKKEDDRTVMRTKISLSGILKPHGFYGVKDLGSDIAGRPPYMFLSNDLIMDMHCAFLKQSNDTIYTALHLTYSWLKLP